MKKRDKLFGKSGRSRNYIDYPGVGIITDEQVADHVMKHTTIFDCLFHPRKIVDAAITSQIMLMGVVDEPEDENWKY